MLVEALDRTGVIRTLSELLKQAAATRANETAAGAGILIAVASNLINNLPAGLVAGSAVTMADIPKSVTSAILIGVDLGPNLSVTGSLATILWLTAIRREGENVGAWRFLKIGLVVMPAALLPTIAALLLLS